MKKIKICGDISHPPYECLDEKGQMSGFAYEVSKAIADQMGLEIEIDLMDWGEALKAFDEGKYDLIQFLSYGGARKKDYLFSLPLLTTFQSVFSLMWRDDIQDISLGNYKVAVQEYDAAHSMFSVNSGKYKELVVTKNQEDALELLMCQEVDIIVGNRLTVSYIASKHNCADKIKLVGRPLNRTKYCMASRHEDTELIEIINEGIEIIKSNGVYEAIYEKWFVDRSASLGYEILSRMDSGAIYIDALGKVKAVNDNAARILTINEEDILFRNFYETEYTDIFEPLLIQEILDGRSETLHKSLDVIVEGEKKYLEINYNRMADERHKTIGVIVTLIDVTEKRRLESMLAEKDKMESLGFLLLNIAHEIRNPLTSIKNFIELLPSEYEDMEFRESLFYHVPNQIKQIDDMLSNLLEYSKPAKANKTMLSVSDILKDIIIESIIKTTKSMNVNLVTEVDEDLYLDCDKNHIKQILINLLLNAVQAVPEGGNLRIEAKPNLDNCEISIINDISPGVVIDSDKLFEPFYTTKPQGTGLGLFITYQLVKENGGEIKIVQTNNQVTITVMFERVKDRIER